MYRKPNISNGHNKYKTKVDYTDKYKCTNYPTDTYLPNITNLNQMSNGANMINKHPSCRPIITLYTNAEASYGCQV